MRLIAKIAAAAALALAAPALAQDAPTLTIGGTTYTKFLWSTQHDQGSMYNFTTVPGEGYGNNGQGTEIELFINGRLSRQVEFKSRLHSRFSQNFWTNYGGFGGSYDPAQGPGQCNGGSCGEYDPRSNQYVKLRGVSVILTPGYRWIDSAVIGSSDLGQFDSFVVGQIRYIDRDNAQGLFFHGSALDRKLSWDLARISLPRLWAGPGYTTGPWHASDASYAGQAKMKVSDKLDFGVIGNYVNDGEIDPADYNGDDGRDMAARYLNGVGGLKFGVHHGPIDLRLGGYYSWSKTYDSLLHPLYDGADGTGNFWFNGYGPLPLGEHKDFSAIANLALSDLLPGLSVNLQGFFIGADYHSMMASRREADVLLTEGTDAVFANPGPNNSTYGVYGGNPTRIGYGGWGGTTQQVPTINVDNEFTDFDEPYAQSAIGWKGLTLAPIYNIGPVELAGEYSYIGYDTNWQAWNDPSRPVIRSEYPTNDLNTGVFPNFRSAYAPFQERTTQILVLRAKYVLNVGKGIDLMGKVKYIRDVDKRLNDARYLPFVAGDCPGGGVACGNAPRAGNAGTDQVFENPPVVGTGYAWKPFDDIADDDKTLDYFAFRIGAGYQLHDDLYLSLAYAKYLAYLTDGNTALQAWGIHRMASGDHDKNQVILNAKYILAGIEFGAEAQYTFGTFTPDFGSGFVPQPIPDGAAQSIGVAPGTLGYPTRRGGWDSLAKRDFEEIRGKAFMKIQF